MDPRMVPKLDWSGARTHQLHRYVMQRLGRNEFSILGLAKEATVLVFVDDTEEILNGSCGRVWLVPVPLEIGSLPVDTPLVCATYVGCLGYGIFVSSAWISKVGTDFEDLDALSLDSEAKVKPWSYVRRWATSLHECGDCFLASLFLELAQRHRSRSYAA